MEESSYNGSFYEQPTDLFGRDNTLSQLTPSEYGSAFSRPSSAFSNPAGYGRFTELGQNGTVAPRVAAAASVKEGRSETEDELSQYGWEDNGNQWNRRPSLPLHHRPGSKKWDFKSRRRSSFKAPKLIGRVSPLTPSNPPPFSSSPPFPSKHSPPSPVKDQLILEVNETQNASQSASQENIDTDAANSELIERQRTNEDSIDNSGELISSEHHQELEENESPHSATGTPEPPPTSSPALPTTVSDTPEWPQNDTLPAYEEEETHDQASSPPILYTTVKVLKSTLNHSPTGSLARTASRVSTAESSSTHPADLVNIATPPQSLFIRANSPRRKSAPDTSVAMKPKYSSGTESKSHSTSSFEPMQNYKRTIHKANEFERQMRALAESGSSDQDSDSEPRETPEGVTVSEHQKIQEKMRTTIGNNRLHQISLKRKLGTSFGFSLSDGCYDPGIFVKAVKEGSPADKSGLLPYDKMLKVCVHF